MGFNGSYGLEFEGLNLVLMVNLALRNQKESYDLFLFLFFIFLLPLCNHYAHCYNIVSFANFLFFFK